MERLSSFLCVERMLNVRQTKVRHLKSMEIHPKDLFTIEKQHPMFRGKKTKMSQENIFEHETAWKVYVYSVTR